MYEEGWVKLYRCLLGKPVWKQLNPSQRCVMITCLLLANHKDNHWLWNGQMQACKRGQFITSLAALASTADVSIQSVRSALLKLEKMDFLTSNPTTQGRLISIVNWELYQGEYLSSTNDPTNDQQTTNKRPTNDQQTTQQLTRNKECKNVKNVRKKDIYGEYKHVQLAADEYQRLIQDFGQDLTDRAIKVVDEYVESSGKKYKNYNLTIRKWGIESARKEEEKNAGSTSRRAVSVEQYYRDKYPTVFGNGDKEQTVHNAG